MRKSLVVILILAAAAFAGWKYFGQTSHRGGTQEAMRHIPVSTGDIEEQVTAQGKLEAKDYVDVGTQVSGQLQKIHVNIGDDVKAGQLLVEIDPRVYQSKVDADEAHLKTLTAQLAEQQAQLDLARMQKERNEKLLKTDAVSHDVYEQSEAAWKTAAARIDELKAEIEEQQSALGGDKTNLAYTKISAPMAGTVVDAALREGQTVNASQSAPTILRIANLDVMTVRAQVAEADVMRLKEGMPVYFTTMGQMDRKWPAKIRQILPTPEVLNNVVLYDVLIDSENKGHVLMSGMSTQVFFVIGSAKGVPLVPVEALTRRDAAQDNDKGTAYIVRVAGAQEEESAQEDKSGKGARHGGRKPGERVIHVGLMDRTMAEVKDGLKEGDEIVLPPLATPAKQGAGGGGFRGGPRL
jgi:macrolide-specific efflux system membrane fusion protein